MDELSPSGGSEGYGACGDEETIIFFDGPENPNFHTAPQAVLRGRRVFNNFHRVFHSPAEGVEGDIKDVNHKFIAVLYKKDTVP